MGKKTAIEYCDSTINPIMGCDGCELYHSSAAENHCYAAELTKRYAGKKGWPKSFDEPTLFSERLPKACGWRDLAGKDRTVKPWLNGYPRVIFANDLSDSFTESIDLRWMFPYIDRMRESPHIWLWLTKRPHRMRQAWENYLIVPKNFILGTTITRQNNTARRRLYQLLAITRSPKPKDGLCHYWLSIEPMLEAIDLEELSIDTWGLRLKHATEMIRSYGGSLWVACGGESGHNRRPFDPDWGRRLRDQCAEAEVPFFMKQIDKKTPIPSDLRIRQMPKEWLK